MAEPTHQSLDPSGIRKHSFFSTFTKAFDFDSRASRQEFWPFTAVCTLIMLLGAAIDVSQGWFDMKLLIGPISGLALIAFCIPCFSVTVRRLHDSDTTGWVYVFNFIPMVGPFIILFYMVIPGTEGPNEYGADPHGDLGATGTTAKGLEPHRDAPPGTKSADVPSSSNDGTACGNATAVPSSRE